MSIPRWIWIPLTLLLLPLTSVCLIEEIYDCGGGGWGREYSPPSPPPPPPPHPPTVSCERDLDGVGSLDATCQIVTDLNLTGPSVYIQGTGNFFILPNVKVNCSVPGYEIGISISGNFSLGENASIVAGTFDFSAANSSFSVGSMVNTTGLAGDPPAQTSGTPQGTTGAGGTTGLAGDPTNNRSWLTLGVFRSHGV